MLWLGRSLLLASATFLLVAACGARTGLFGAGLREGDGGDVGDRGDGGSTLPDGMTLPDGATPADGTAQDVEEAGPQTCPSGSIPLDGGCIVTIAAGDDHTCAMTNGGGVQCWGANGSGQLGNNTTDDSHVPVPVVGLASGVIAIAAGGIDTCALTGGGVPQCWGANGAGQLGNDSSAQSNVPVAVSGLGSGVTAIAAGVYHTCAVTTGGAAECWGDNIFGELGDNATVESTVPAHVSGLGSGVIAIAPGGNHTCALTSDGSVQCWGLDTYGQLGDGSTSTSLVPASAASGSAVGLAVGWFHSCALIGGGGVQCWGANSYGELGNGSTKNSDAPIAVSGLRSGVVAIAAGGNHTCALTSGGGVQCWGSNTYGELGNNSTVNSSVPVAVVGLGSGVTAIAAGRGHTCAQARLGTVQCWGDNEYGQLGNNSSTNSSVPVAVVGF